MERPKKFTKGIKDIETKITIYSNNFQHLYSGILWCLAPICYALSMTINGLIFVPKLRQKGYVTLIDSLQDAFGETVGGLVYLPSCIGDICWTSAVLSALGTTLSVILGIDTKLAIGISALVAITYTLIGGMYSVAYTDVIQVVFIFGGLWIVIPFMWTNEKVGQVIILHLIG